MGLFFSFCYPVCLSTLSISFLGDGLCTWVWQRAMSIPQMGNTEVVAQVILNPLPPHSAQCAQCPPWPSHQADVSSLSKGLARAGRRPMPVGTIRPRVDGTNSRWPAGPFTGWPNSEGHPLACKTSGPPQQDAEEQGWGGGVWEEVGCLV